MKKLTKKNVLIVIVLIASISIYFRPLQLSNLVSEENVLWITCSNVGVQDSTPYANAQSFQDITEEQINQIIMLFEEYSYHRKLNTIFLDGFVSGSKNTTSLHLFFSDGTVHTNAMILTNHDEIAVNYKNYRINNSSDLIDEILEIIKE